MYFIDTIDMRKRRLSDAYRFPGFKPRADVVGVFGDPKARIVRLARTGKKLSVAVVARQAFHIMIAAQDGFGIYLAVIRAFFSKSRSGVCNAGPVGK